MHITRQTKWLAFQIYYKKMRNGSVRLLDRHFTLHTKLLQNEYILFMSSMRCVLLMGRHTQLLCGAIYASDEAKQALNSS